MEAGPHSMKLAALRSLMRCRLLCTCAVWWWVGGRGGEGAHEWRSSSASQHISVVELWKGQKVRIDNSALGLGVRALHRCMRCSDPCAAAMLVTAAQWLAAKHMPST
jgi:hypothetical protein